MTRQDNAILRYRSVVSERLDAFLGEQRKTAIRGPAWQTDVVDRLSRFVRGGKLLRGSLVCYSYKLFEQEAHDSLPDVVLSAAVAAELLHAALLIHDDIIDDDDVRRGQPAIHKQYRDLLHEHPLAAGRFGASMALCAGDMILSMAFSLLASSTAAHPDTGRELSSLFANALITTAAGQMQDISLGTSPNQPGKRRIYEIMRTKTATYSIALPLAAGAAAAEQSSTVCRQLQDLGLAIGIIFQIRDDELGVFAKAESIGKPIGSDIREGKKTLLYHYAWQAANRQERKQLGSIFGDPQATASSIATVRKIMIRHQVQKRLQQDIDILEHRAHQQINRLTTDQTARQELYGLVTYCSRRNT